MSPRLRWSSPSGFVVVLVCFFLPWVNYSCGSDRSSAVTGVQLLVGATLEQTTVEREEWVMATLGFTVAGTAVSVFLAGRHLLLLALSAGALVSHVMTAISISTHTILESAFGFQVHLMFGFWIVLVCLVLLVLLSSYVLVRERRVPSSPRGQG